MISAFNLNPTLDITAPLRHALKPGVYRVEKITASMGGKASNTASALASLGIKCALSGFIPENNYEETCRFYSRQQLKYLPVITPGALRPCILISSQSSEYTINSASGVAPDPRAAKNILQKIRQLSSSSKAAVFSGSLPQGLMPDFYYHCVKAAVKGCVTVLDASGPALLHAIKASPHTVKINSDEALATFGADLSSPDKAARFLKSVSQKYGVKTFIITSGPGRIHAMNGGFYYSFIPARPKGALHPAGSGDAFTAGYCYGIEMKYDFEKTVSAAIACAAANLKHPQPCVFSKNEALKILKPPRGAARRF